MKFIYILPLESQNITNFTFWKVISLEHKEIIFLLPPVRWTHSLQFPQMKVLFDFPLNLDWQGLSWERSEWTLAKGYSEEADPNIWASQATAH